MILSMPKTWPYIRPLFRTLNGFLNAAVVWAILKISLKISKNYARFGVLFCKYTKLEIDEL